MWTRMDTVKYNKAFAVARVLVDENFKSVGKDARGIITTMIALKVLEEV